MCVTCKLEKQLFRVVSCIESYFPQTLAKPLGDYPLRRVITVAGATLLKSLSAVDILLPILQEFRNVFLEEHIRRADEATCFYFSVMTPH